MSRTFALLGGQKRGFFSVFSQILQNLHTCTAKGYIPIVEFGNMSRYWQKGGYNGSMEPWEYYFEPVSKFKSKDITAPDKLESYKAWIGGYKSDWFRFEKEASNLGHRKDMNRVIKQYIQVKPCIQEKVDKFYSEKMEGEFVLGIHMRSTDFFYHADPLSFNQFIEVIDEIFKGEPKFKIFVSTETTVALQEVVDRYPKRTIYCDHLRSSTTRNPLWSAPNVAKQGEEVLVECLLLSKCNHLISGQSSIPIIATYFNPQLEHTYLPQKYRGCPDNNIMEKQKSGKEC